MSAKLNLPLGEQMVQRGLISPDQLRIALREQQQQGVQLGKLLVALGFLTEASLRDVMSSHLGQTPVDLARTVVDATAIRLVDKAFATRHLLLPVFWHEPGRSLVLAMANPHDLLALDQLRTSLGRDILIETRLASEGELLRAIDQYYGHELSIDGILHEIEAGEAVSVGPGEAGGYGQPVVRLIDALLLDAVRQRASDIHFEPEASFVRIRYRIDGVMRQIRSLHKTYWPPMAVRLKVMSSINIAESRAPQDGRLSLVLSGRPVDFRVSSLPTLHGENLVLRVLDRQKSLLSLDSLGLQPDALARLKRMLSRPEGLILMTGPTGSGKTTTLYSVLGELNREGVNIMTLEDPVEYPLGMIRQTSVNELVKLDFASGIRSMLRQDPDIILIGEIRDADTATMAFRAAMTGHQVYSTLHANSAAGAIPRLWDIGIPPDIVAGNLIGVIAQRLVRKLCTHCRQPYRPDDFELQLLGVTSEGAPKLFRAAGCSHCQHQGYRGRMAVMEVLPCDAEIDELIARRASGRSIRQAAQDKGMRSLAEDASRRVLEGLTSLEEVCRVVDLGERLGW